MKFSELVKQEKVISSWHPTKNGNLTLSTLGRGNARKKFWWTGDCGIDGHDFEATVSKRSTGVACPYCSGHKILIGFNDLTSVNPELAIQWHPTKNGDLTPQQVSQGSGKKVWWVGNCGIDGHEWETKIVDRSSRLSCAVCSGHHFITGVNDLATTHPTLAAEWHPTKNNDFTPQQTSKGNPTKVWWLGECGHEWVTQLASRTGRRNSGCPYCAHKTLLVGETDILTLYPHLQDELHPTKNDKDLDLSLEPMSSFRKVWWRCSLGHEWETTINNRRGSGCRYCAGSLLTGFNDLATVDPVLASQWHPTRNDTLTAREVTSQANRKVWWLGACGHEWDALISSRFKGARCPYCSGKKFLRGFNDLRTLRPDLSSEWHPTKNGELTPDMIFARTLQKVWWQCDTNNHDWFVSPVARKNNSGCPKCVFHKTENEFRGLFNDLTEMEFSDDLVPVRWNKKSSTQIDILNEENKICIEYDGFWSHGGQPPSTLTLEECIEQDVRKTEALLEAGYTVLRIRDSKLPELPISANRFFQLPYKMRQDKSAVVQRCIEFLNSLA